MEKIYCVYKHTSPSNKTYIGITCRKPEYRWNNGKGYCNNKHFTNAINKYGWDNFIHEILFEGLTKEEACQKEIELISYYKSNQMDFGYNLSSGGECTTQGCHFVFSEEHKRKIGEAQKGKKVTEESRRKMSDAHTGVPLSEKHKKSLSEALKGEKNGFYGKHHSEETKRKFSKPVIMYDLNNKETNRFNSLTEACREMNLPKHAFKNVSECCRGKRKTAYGFIWRYADETQ